MAFADPLTVTVATVGHPMARVGFGANSGAFRSADGLYDVAISHSYGARNRTVIRLNVAKVAADPLLAGVNVRASMSAYLVLDTPVNGFSATEVKDIGEGLCSFLTASSSAKLTQLIGGEN